MISPLVSLELGPPLNLIQVSLSFLYWDTDNGLIFSCLVDTFLRWAGLERLENHMFFCQFLLQNVWKTVTVFMIFGWNSFFNFVATLGKPAFWKNYLAKQTWYLTKNGSQLWLKNLRPTFWPILTRLQIIFVSNFNFSTATQIFFDHSA